MSLRWPVIAMALFMIVEEAESTTYTWIGAPNASYGTSTNWMPTGVPGPADTATIMGGTVTVDSSSTTGTLDLTNATLTLAMLGQLTANAITLESGTSRIQGDGGSFSLNGNVSGTGVGNPILSLQPSNNSVFTFSGMSISQQNGALISLDFQNSGGSFTLGGTNNTATINNITDMGNSSTLLNLESGGALTLENNPAVGSSLSQYAGGLSGSGNLIVNAGSPFGGGLNLSNTGNKDTSTGGVQMNTKAFLQMPSIDCMGSGDLILSGGSYSPGDVLTTSKNITVTGEGTIFNINGAVALNGTIEGNGTLKLIGSIAFDRTFTLSGMNTYSNGTTIYPGIILEIGSVENIGGSSAAITLQGGILRPTGAVSTSGSITVTDDSTIDGTMGTVTSSGTLTCDEVTTLTCSGNVSLSTVFVPVVSTIDGVLTGGSQAFTKTGGGDLTLNASIAYSELMTVSAGILILTNTGNKDTSTGGVQVNTGAVLEMPSMDCMGSGDLVLSGGSFLPTAAITTSKNITVDGQSTIFAVYGDLTLNGNLAGSGSLTLTGDPGGIHRTATLSGTNTYPNGTTIGPGVILSIGSEDNIGGSSTAITLAGGTLQPTGAISPSGSITVNANSTIDGSMATVTSSGTLTGSNTKTLTCSGDVSLSTVSVPSGTFTIGGFLTGGSQAFTKTGAGTLVLTSSNTYTELTTVSAGTLTFSSSLITGPVAVSSDAMLTGVGTIGGNLTISAGGTVRPGNSPGTITIGGDFIPADPTSIIAIEVTPAGATSLFDIAGDAILNGNGTLQFTVDPGTYIPGTSFTFLTAMGTIQGQFGSDNLSGLFLGLNPTLIYGLHSIMLLLSAPTQISLTGLTGNNLAVANYLNSLSTTLGSSFTNLVILNGNALDQALSTISPSRNSFATYISEVTLFSCSNILNAHAATLRLMREIPTSSSLLVENEEISTPSTCKPVSSSCQFPYSLWMTGFGELGRQKAADQNPHFHVQTGGAMAGFDWVNSHISSLRLDSAGLGLAAVYFHSDIDQGDSFGDNTLDAGILGLYGTLSTSHFYFESSLWNGYQSIENKRNVFFTDFSETAKSQHNAYIGDAHLGLGYDYEFQSGCFNGIFEPFAALDWAYNWEAKYKEEGAAPYNMQVKSHFSSMLQAEVGANFFAGWQLSKGLLVLSQKASYLHRTPFHVGNLSTNLVGFPGNLAVTSFHREQNLFSPSAKITWRSSKGHYGSLLYTGEFGDGWNLNELVLRLGTYF